MSILVTGGAGYIGSIVAEELLKRDYEVVILDNLCQGHRQAVLPRAQFVAADTCDAASIDEVFQSYSISAVMHFAAETVVEFSVTDPKRYFHTNVLGGINLLDAMLRHRVYEFIFSSSAAIYGEPESVPISEGHPKAPINSYGESKLMFERVLEWYGRAYGVKHISLRYFNAAGASQNLGEDHRPETHLIPNVLKAALDINRPVAIFGTDYPTRDGSCIRDYIHVVDIARAHVLALGKLETLGGKAYNLGNGEGYSVLEVVQAARRVTSRDIPCQTSPRRSGDPAVLVADSSLAKEELGWTPEHAELEDIVESSWRWMRERPNGYS
ncbi:MAG: UDP-glucose 4-epimerase GalE [Chloroflexi bacterium]|nr:UDP-glucose 4-epimerase GalE [Chloroflexota bacterium]